MIQDYLTLRQIDANIEIHIFGRKDIFWEKFREEFTPCYYDDDGWDTVAEYSDDIRAAWRVVEKVIERAEFYMEKKYNAGLDRIGFSVTFDFGNSVVREAWSENAAKAICIAALRAVNVL